VNPAGGRAAGRARDTTSGRLLALLGALFAVISLSAIALIHVFEAADQRAERLEELDRGAAPLARRLSAIPPNDPDWQARARAVLADAEALRPLWRHTVLRRGAAVADDGGSPHAAGPEATLEVVVPIADAGTASEDARLSLRIEADLTADRAAGNRRLLTRALVAAAAMLVALVATWRIIDRLVLAPLDRLYQPLARMAAGGEYEPVEPSGWREISVVTAQVNRVVAALLEREAENRAAAATLDLVRRHLPDVVYRYDVAERRFVFLSDSIRALGWTPEDLADGAEPFGEGFLHPDDAAAARRRREEHVAKGPGAGSLVREFRVRRPDGEVRWLEDHLTPEFDAQGRLAAASGVLRDITAQKAADEALRRVDALSRALADTAMDAMVTTDEQGIVTSANPAVERIFGHDPAALVGRPLSVLLAPGARAALGEALARVAAAGEDGLAVVPARTEGLHRDGRTVPLEVSVGVAGARGVRVHTAVLRDLTRQQEMEQRLLQAQKMEAVGTLAGGIAHDFNNILSVMVGQAELAALRLDQRERVEESLRAIVEAGTRAADLTARLLGFARRRPTEVRPIDVGEVLDRVVSLLSRTVDRAIRIHTDVPAGLAVLADAAQVEHAVLNLCLNARDAMPQGGVLTLAARPREDAPDRAELALGARTTPFVRITVEDTGTGIPPEVRARLFEPFFTTKGRGRGTGLGLAMVYGVVRSHGGWVDVETAVGRGSRFHLHFPAAPAGAEVARAPGPATPAPSARGSESVLVVDDDASVRGVLVDALTSHGYRVLEAADGQAAVAVLRREPAVALVVLDMILPGMGGREVFRRIRAERRDVRVILSTGFSEDGDAQAVLAEGGDGILRKPYRPHDLAQRVREVLDRPRAPHGTHGSGVR
jgi:PAS domain S-box-containing protein